MVRQTLLGMVTLATSLFASVALAQQPVVLKAVTAWDKSLTFVDKYMDWIKRVNDKGAGKVRIDYVGGPEVYPSFEQLEPLRRGVFSTVVTSTAYVAGALPELNATWFGFGATPAELRAAGLIDALDKVTREKAGVAVLGLPLQMRFNVYLKRPIAKADLTGLKLRTTPVYEPVLKALGASTVTVPPAELLTALETGIVDGFAWPAVAVTGPGYARAVKFKITPPWWVGTDVALINAKAFDALSPDVRKILIDAMIEIEKEVPAYYQEKEKAEDVAMAKMGIQNIATTDADMVKIRKAHWEAGTKIFLTGPSPKYGPGLVEVMKRYVPN
jgi:TRAP-type transport system periplasmic protein